MITWIIHNNKNILYSDYRGLNHDEGIKNLIQEAEVIREQKTPVLVLDNFTNYMVFPEFLALGKKLGKEVQPHVFKMAQVGITGVKKIIANAFMQFSGMPMRMFTTEKEGFKYLTED